MAGSVVDSDILVIDVDTHVLEPPDLWTSRLGQKWGDSVPLVRWDESTQKEYWYIEGRRSGALGGPAQAGWSEFPPDHPPRWSDIDAKLWDAPKRLEVMDEYGIYAEVLYPNVAVFGSAQLQQMSNPEMLLDCITAYNDFQTEWSAPAPERLLPITVLPFWDLEKSLAEMERCAAAGHRGISFSQEPGHFGLEPLVSRHWDPLWAAAQEMGQSVNFHIATADSAPAEYATNAIENLGAKLHAMRASSGVQFFLGNAATIIKLICGGICHRFPRLDFVTVESGIGWIPFALEALDWQWKNLGVPEKEPEYDLLPSEYFRRQIYGCFWFEEASAKFAIETLGPDNILYETDYPHPTSMSPGPATAAIDPKEYYEGLLGDFPYETRYKILRGNAERIYRI